jgi:membrane protease YdiL (CAAX protease family)
VGKSFLKRHSLSLTTAAILVLWTVLYVVGDPQSRWGAFYGNAMADWTGVLVTVLATKFLYERGSAESKAIPRNQPTKRIAEGLRDHSLTIFLLVTGAAWIALYSSVDSNSKWGQVVGNIVSEWTQILGLVLMTKKLIEPGSKESK